MERLNDVGLAAAMKAFHKGPPGVVRKVAQHDSTPPEYEPIPTTYNDERAAIGEAIRAYLDAMESVSADRWDAFSDEEIADLASLVSAADESYDLSADSERLSAEVKAERDHRETRLP